MDESTSLLGHTDKISAKEANGTGANTAVNHGGLPSGDDETSSQDERISLMLEKLLEISNIASLLCVVDCTVLPIVTVMLPLFGLAGTNSATMDWLHSLGRGIALYFVLPGKLIGY